MIDRYLYFYNHKRIQLKTEVAPLTPVSYTHLDVYKRQGYTFFDTAECYTGTNPDGSTAYNEEAVGMGIKPFRDKIVPVSYTHLDVYKRQRYCS